MPVTPTNSVPAEALTPETTTAGDGYQRVRIPLRTETGTIVYADLSPVEADILAHHIARQGRAAQQHNDALGEAAAAAAAADAQVGKLGEMVRRAGGAWTEERFTECARISLGYTLIDLEAHDCLEELVELGVLHSERAGRYQTRR
ncbi:hypothetical protein [Streptomyces goshikiensis]